MAYFFDNDDWMNNGLASHGLFLETVHRPYMDSFRSTLRNRVTREVLVRFNPAFRRAAIDNFFLNAYRLLDQTTARYKNNILFLELTPREKRYFLRLLDENMTESIRMESLHIRD